MRSVQRVLRGRVQTLAPEHLGTDVRTARLAAASLVVCGLGGCGTYVPDLRDWPNNSEVGSGM